MSCDGEVRNIYVWRRGVLEYYDDDDGTLATVDCSPRPCNDDVPWMYNTWGMVTLGDTLSGHTFSFGHFNQLLHLHHVGFVCCCS